MSALCPVGFDCALLNACPAPIVPCPPGFYCDSYAGSPLLDDLDYGYAQLKSLYSEDVITRKNMDEYVVPDRAVQTQCFMGFYCPNATTILVSLNHPSLRFDFLTRRLLGWLAVPIRSLVFGAHS